MYKVIKNKVLFSFRKEFNILNEVTGTIFETFSDEKKAINYCEALNNHEKAPLYKVFIDSNNKYWVCQKIGKYISIYYEDVYRDENNVAYCVNPPYSLIDCLDKLNIDKEKAGYVCEGNSESWERGEGIETKEVACSILEQLNNYRIKQDNKLKGTAVCCKFVNLIKVND